MGPEEVGDAGKQGKPDKQAYFTTKCVPQVKVPSNFPPARPQVALPPAMPSALLDIHVSCPPEYKAGRLQKKRDWMTRIKAGA